LWYQEQALFLIGCVFYHKRREIFFWDCLVYLGRIEQDVLACILRIWLVRLKIIFGSLLNLAVMLLEPIKRWMHKKRNKFCQVFVLLFIFFSTKIQGLINTAAPEQLL
jgi:hypothetical protein